MKKQVIIIFATILITFYSQAQKEVSQMGTYKGVFTQGNFTDAISFEIKKDSTEWQVLFSSLEQNAFQIPARNVTVKGDSINFILQSDKYKYDFTNILNERKNQLKGTLKVDTVVVTYTLKKLNLTQQNGPTPEEVHFQHNGLMFGGTIWKPEKPSKKAIIFITSSGGGDRSGSRAEAIYFAEKGLTTFHYDKRGTGVSEGNWQSSNMGDLISDDMNAINYFSEQTGTPISQIGIKGSSQGATKVPYILNKLKDLNFGIAVSCPGSTLLESDLNYWKNRNRQALGDNLENAALLQRRVFAHIAGKISRTELDKAIENEESKPWFNSVWIPNLDEVMTDEKLLYSGLPYFEKTKQPLLIIQGTDDEIIPIDSHVVITEALEKANNKKHTTVLLENANHSMYNTGKSDFVYWAKLHEDYLRTIDEWVKFTFE